MMGRRACTFCESCLRISVKACSIPHMEIVNLLDTLERKLASLIDEVASLRAENDALKIEVVDSAEKLRNETEALKAEHAAEQQVFGELAEEARKEAEALKAQLATERQMNSEIAEQLRGENEALKAQLAAERQVNGDVADRIEALLGRIDGQRTSSD